MEAKDIYMQHTEFNKCIEDAISGYREMLLTDFEQHPDFERLAAALCFNGLFNISEYVLNLEIQDFESRRYIEKILPSIEMLKFGDVDKINHNYQHVRPQEFDQYYFFDRQEYNSYEELSEKFSGYFYLCNKDFVSRLDDLFIKQLAGYNKRKGYFFEKKIGKGASLIIDARKSRKHFETIEDYKFPGIYLELNNEKYFFTNEFDSFSFFFIAANSYINFFYKNRRMAKSSDEPVVYQDADSDKYILTNSLENLTRFNKYIFLNTDLFCHYFSVFEKWVQEVFITSLNTD